MDIKSLQLFKHLATSLHFGKTAAATYVSPSTLSRAIQRLEQECGAPLFVRDNRTVTLTAAGKRMLTFTQDVLQAWQALQHDLDEHNEVLRGELSVFCSVTASHSHLPELLDRFRQHYPQVEIKLITGDPADSVRHVIEGDTDVAIAIHTPDFPSELAFVHLDTIPLVLIAPRGLNLTSLAQIDWHLLQMILPESGPSRRIVHHWLAEEGIRPKIYAQVGGNEAIVSMVALGCGIGIVPQVVVDNSIIADKVSCFTLNNIEPYKLGLCCLKPRQDEPLIQALKQQIQAS